MGVVYFERRYSGRGGDSRCSIFLLLLSHSKGRGGGWSLQEFTATKGDYLGVFEGARPGVLGAQIGLAGWLGRCIYLPVHWHVFIWPLLRRVFGRRNGES